MGVRAVHDDVILVEGFAQLPGDVVRDLPGGQAEEDDAGRREGALEVGWGAL